MAFSSEFGKASLRSGYLRAKACIGESAAGVTLQERGDRSYSCVVSRSARQAPCRRAWTISPTVCAL